MSALTRCLNEEAAPDYAAAATAAGGKPGGCGPELAGALCHQRAKCDHGVAKAGSGDAARSPHLCLKRA